MNEQVTAPTEVKPDAQPDARQFLNAAKAPAKKKANHLEYNHASAVELAKQFLVWDKQEEESKREKDLVRDQILQLVSPWHKEQCRQRRGHFPTVEIPTADGNLRVSFQHRYCKITKDQEDALRDAVGVLFEQFFRETFGIRVRKEICDDSAKLQDLVAVLSRAMGPTQFGHYFEVEQTLQPTVTFTENKPAIEESALRRLEAAGVKQIVAIAKAA